MARNIVTGLDIGTGSIRVVVCEYRKGSKIPHVLALVRKSSKGLRRGYVVQFDEVVESIQEAVKAAETAAKVRIKRVFLGIGGITLETAVGKGESAVSRPDSEIADFDVERALQASQSSLTGILNKSVIHRVPLKFVLDGELVLGRPESMRGKKLEAEVMFITTSTQHLADLTNTVERAGLIIEDIVASPLAASFSTLTKLQKASGCVLANIGSQTTSIIIFEDGKPISIKVFPYGSTDITNDIALGLQIPIEDAERIKLGTEDPMESQKKLDNIIEARLSDIFEVIEKHLKVMKVNGLLPAGIVITGGGSNISSIEELARQYFRLPARIAEEAISASSRNQIRDSVWSVAFGLCLYGSQVDLESGPVDRGPVFAKVVNFLKELLP